MWVFCKQCFSNRKLCLLSVSPISDREKFDKKESYSNNKNSAKRQKKGKVRVVHLLYVYMGVYKLKCGFDF